MDLSVDMYLQIGDVDYGFDVHGIDHPDDVGNFKGGDYGLVIHLAAWADIRESLEKPEAYYINNVVKAKPIFDWCRETNTRLLYASSSAVDDFIGRIHMQ